MHFWSKALTVAVHKTDHFIKWSKNRATIWGIRLPGSTFPSISWRGSKSVISLRFSLLVVIVINLFFVSIHHTIQQHPSVFAFQGTVHKQISAARNCSVFTGKASIFLAAKSFPSLGVDSFPMIEPWFLNFARSSDSIMRSILHCGYTCWNHWSWIPAIISI